MDEMRIRSGFMKNIVAGFVKKAVKKKAGCDVDIHLNELSVTVTDGATHIHLSMDADLSKEELMKLLETIGL